MFQILCPCRGHTQDGKLIIPILPYYFLGNQTLLGTSIISGLPFVPFSLIINRVKYDDSNTVVPSLRVTALLGNPGVKSGET